MQSMTGYGKETSRQGDWEMTVELRAVNHRFLDLSMRLGRRSDLPGGNDSQDACAALPRTCGRAADTPAYQRF